MNYRTEPGEYKQPLLGDADRVGLEHAKAITDLGDVSAVQKEQLENLKATFFKGEPGKCLNAFNSIEKMAGFRMNQEDQKVLEATGDQSAWPPLFVLYASKKLTINGKEQDNPIHRLLGNDPKEFQILYKCLLERGEAETLVEAAKNFQNLHRLTNNKKFFNYTRECYLQADVVTNTKKHQFAVAELAMEDGNTEEAKVAYQAYYEWQNQQGNKEAYQELAELLEKLKDVPKALKAYEFYIDVLAKESERSSESAKNLVQFCETLKLKGPQYADLAKKGLKIAGKYGCMNAFITLGRWEGSQNYFMDAFALAATKEEFLQVIQALNDNALSEKHLESILKTPITGKDIDIAISKGKYLANAINALAYLYNQSLASVKFPPEPQKLVENQDKISYPVFDRRKPKYPCCRRCCECCANGCRCILYGSCCKCLNWISTCSSSCCKWCAECTYSCQGDYWDWGTFADKWGQMIDDCFKKCCDCCIDTYDTNCCATCFLFLVFFAGFPCVALMTIGKCCCASHHACCDNCDNCCYDLSRRCDIDPGYRDEVLENYRLAVSDYNYQLEKYKKNKAVALEEHKQAVAEKTKNYQNSMVAFNKAVDLCNQELETKRAYEAKRRTISSFLKNRAEALDKALEKGDSITCANLDAYRQEAYQLVIEASL